MKQKENLKFGELVHRLRKEKKLSLGELEKASGVGKGYIWELEHGVKDNPSIDIVQKISRALDVPASLLLGETQDEWKAGDIFPRGLKEFLDAKKRGGTPLTAADVLLLQQTQYRMRKAPTPESWEALYKQLKESLK